MKSNFLLEFYPSVWTFGKAQKFLTFHKKFLDSHEIPLILA